MAKPSSKDESAKAGPGHSLSSRLFSLTMVFLLVGIKIWLVSDQKIVSLYLPYDDLLYVESAESMSRGDWLGDYHDRTLTKAPGYAVWLTLMKRLDIPVLFSQHMVYAASVVLIAVVLMSAGASRAALFAGVFILLFSPESFSNDQLRLSRMYLYDAFTLLLTALWLMSLFAFRWRHLLPLVVVYSCVTAYYTILREEFIWVVPLYLLVVLIYGTKYRHHPLSKLGCRIGVLLLVPAVTAVACDTCFKAINEDRYGVANLYEYRDGQFPAAIGSLYRIAPDSPIQHVPVPKKARALAYDISPTFRRLENQLEGDVGRKWTELGYTFSNVSDDISGGVFVVAVREAASNLGYHASAKKAESFYGAIADEINGACREGLLSCGPRHTALRPIFHRSQLVPWLVSFCQGLSQLWYWPPDLMTERLQSDIYALPVFFGFLGDQVDLPRYSNFNAEYYVKNNPGLASRGVGPFEHYLVEGRFQGKEPNERIGEVFDRNYYVQNNPDVAAMNMDPYRHYLSFGQFEGRSPAQEAAGAALQPLEKKPDSIQYPVRNALRFVYSALTKFFSLCGLFLLFRFLLNVARRRPGSQRDSTTGIILLVAAAGIVSRVGLMAYCDATTFPGFGGYLLPAYGLFSLFCAATAVVLLDAWKAQAAKHEKGTSALYVDKKRRNKN